MNFKVWLESTVGNENVDSQIDHIYNKAKYAIKLVQIYSKATNQRLLNNISTISPLHAGVYGLYNSVENKKIIGPSVANQIKFKFGDNLIQQNKMQKLPNAIIKKYIPDIDERQLIPSDVIHVNVARIVRELGDSSRAIIEIASTIVHEATHELEFQTIGKTDESGPKRAETLFKNWVKNNWNLILSKIPQLRNF